MYTEKQYNAITPTQTADYINYSDFTDLEEPVLPSSLTWWGPDGLDFNYGDGQLFAPEIVMASCGLEPNSSAPYEFPMNDIPSSPSKMPQDYAQFLRPLSFSETNRIDSSSDQPPARLEDLSIQKLCLHSSPSAKPRKRSPSRRKKAKPLASHRNTSVQKTPQHRKLSQLPPGSPKRPQSKLKLKTPCKTPARRISRVYRAGLNGGMMSRFGVETDGQWKPFDGEAKELFGYIPSSTRKSRGNKESSLRLFAWRPGEV